jgi:NADP-dependent 3-hydroxy acid dehydrogenase YdfG
MNLKNKVIVITGGSKGFGKTLAKLFIENGSNVVINSNNETEIKEVANEIGAMGICADVTKEEELTNLLNNVLDKFGDIDIWINNAGIWLPHDFVENFDMSKVRKMFEVNVMGTINGVRVALREMKKNNTGIIINIISDSALAGTPTSSLYSSSKWAVRGLTESIRKENKDITILSVYPGAMKTDIFGDKKPEKYEKFMETEYVANLVIENLKLENPEEELIIKNREN